MADLTAFISKHYAVVFYLSGVLGMLAHYAKKWGKGEYKGSLFSYMFTDCPKATLAAVLTYTGAAATIMATGTLAGMDVATVGALGFTTGYAIDSSVNNAK